MHGRLPRHKHELTRYALTEPWNMLGENDTEEYRVFLNTANGALAESVRILRSENGRRGRLHTRKCHGMITKTDMIRIFCSSVLPVSWYPEHNTRGAFFHVLHVDGAREFQKWLGYTDTNSIHDTAHETDEGKTATPSDRNKTSTPMSPEWETTRTV